MENQTEDTDRRPYHEKNLPLWPDFELMNNDVDGRIPVCRVESWQTFIEIINRDKDDPTGREKIYRGQRRYDWQLESKLTRDIGGGAIPYSVSDMLLFRFKLAMRGRGSDLTNWEDNEIWSFGQHFGLSTPLLDWTESPFVALFFAFADEDRESEIENPTRTVFCMNREIIEAAFGDLLGADFFFEPTYGENGRLVNQAGLFTVTPPGDDNLASVILNLLIEHEVVDADDPKDVAQFLCKFHIPNTSRANCLAALRKMNIHHANLFPDPTGASQYCNDWLSRYSLRQKAITATASGELKRVSGKSTAKVEVFDLISSDADDAANIKTILLQNAPSDALVTDESSSVWAEKISATFSSNVSLDWTVHDSAIAHIKVAFRRLLGALSYPSEARDAAVSELIKYFEEKYPSPHSKEKDD